MNFHRKSFAIEPVFIFLLGIVLITATFSHNVLGDSKTKVLKDDKMCKNQMEHLLDGYQKKELWALKVFDSWGKSQSGLFSGNLINFGHYDQCLQMKHVFKDSNVGVYQGQHCMIFFQDNPNATNTTATIQDMILPQVIHIDLMRQYANVFNVKLGNALCVPSVCSANMVRLIADNMLAKNKLKTTTDYDQAVFCNTINILDMRSIDMFAV